ncbi:MULTISPECIES: T9SS type A sorting domain-containing protein [Niastella]|uniref:T9SS type A sorting domain-containing protein n=1 Tax=Niastella soli TaxID=2821487 RepID=A0ABS3YTI2_9BACT|nr:T9SS type A sorting domain-containing protein [Niastella soli]MBO9201180.1 T9SS type A sorting domain-containing protein [Niastella soli]
MRYRFLHTSLATCMLMVTVQVSAQQNQTTAFAITSSEKGNYNWTDVKQIDLTTGTVTRSIFDSKQTNFTVYNARTGKELKSITKNGVTMSGNTAQPVASLAAACAYDQRHNRLYYAPLFMNQLRYIDLDESTPRIYYFDNEPFMQVTDASNEANHITRMVIGADGDGYALSNDANHLMRFTTGRKPVITDLGALEDDGTNGERSVHAKSTAWGGDMVADAAGNLYVISAYHNVFKVNIQSKVAAWVAEIQGLPATFTTNGAVVDTEGNLIVSSANTAEGYYKVDMHSWNASRIGINGTVFNASDLANGNLAFPNEKPSVPLLGSRDIVVNGNIGLYPNPVVTNQVTVNFNGKESGRYTILLVDITGKVLLEKIAVVNGKQGIPFLFKQGLAKGPYIVKVLSNSKKTVFADKLVIE